MAINFPNTPTIGQLWPSPAVATQPVYRWDGEKWTTQGASLTKTPVYTDGTTPMTAQLTLVTPPVATTDAASKAYVDSRVALMRGYLSGLTLSTGGGSAAFTVAAGVAVDTTSIDAMVLASSLTKNSSAWVVGSAGSLDTGAVAINTWYHAYEIKRPDTGVVDIATSLSASAPTTGGNIPAAYTLFRRIGAMKTDGSGNWTKFFQQGDDFLWDTPVRDVNDTTLGTTATLFTLASIPTGVIVTAKLAMVYTSSTLGAQLLVSSPNTAVQVANSIGGNVTIYVNVVNLAGTATVQIQTDTSARIRAVSIGGGALVWQSATLGWTDRRGRDT